MTPEILEWLETVRERFCPQQCTVLEVGSMDVNGSARTAFGDAVEYLGVDQEAGPGVDLICNAHDLAIGRTFDVVLCCETLEHDTDPLTTIRQMKAHVAPGGLLVVTTPGNGFGEHFCPRDYFRFMANFYEDILFDGMTILEIAQIQGAGQTGPTICGVSRSLQPSLV